MLAYTVMLLTLIQCYALVLLATDCISLFHKSQKFIKMKTVVVETTYIKLADYCYFKWYLAITK